MVYQGKCADLTEICAECKKETCTECIDNHCKDVCTAGDLSEVCDACNVEEEVGCADCDLSGELGCADCTSLNAVCIECDQVKNCDLR